MFSLTELWYKGKWYTIEKDHCDLASWWDWVFTESKSDQFFQSQIFGLESGHWAFHYKIYGKDFYKILDEIN